MIKIKAAASVRCQCLYMEPHLLDPRFPWLCLVALAVVTAVHGVTSQKTVTVAWEERCIAKSWWMAQKIVQFFIQSVGKIQNRHVELTRDRIR